VLTLREEVAYLKGTAGEGDDLMPNQVEELKAQIRAYCDDPDPRSLLNIGTLSLTKLKESFRLFKGFVLEGGGSSSSGRGGGGGGSEYEGQIEDLKACLLQRDNEIAILVNMVKKGKQAAAGGPGMSLATGGGSINANNAIAAGNQFGGDPTLTSRSAGNDGKTLRSKSNGHMGEDESFSSGFGLGGSGGGRDRGGAPTSAPGAGQGPVSKKSEPPVVQVKDTRDKIIERHLFGIAPPDDRAMLEEPADTFKYFSARSKLSESIDENKRILKAKMEEGQLMGERANRSRDAIHFLKSSIEKLRRDKLKVDELYDSKAEDETEDADSCSEADKEEESYRRAIEQEKTVFKDSFEKLRTLKPEIEHVRKLLEKCRNNLQVQFDQWYNNVLSREDILYNSNNNPKHSNYSGSTHTASSAKESSGKSSSDSSFPSITGHRGVGSGGGGSSVRSAVPADVNEDIMAFNLAKEQMLKRRAEEMGKKQMG
jgi:kinesin family member 6/9